MTDQTPALAHGDTYVVIYSGGPNDGRTDTRIATEPTWDTEIIVNGLEESAAAQFVYTVSGVRNVGGTIHVTYTWDPSQGDELEDPSDRNDH